MHRSYLAYVAACCLLVAAGCTMCANPYDECGPMSGWGCSQDCGSNARAGSSISGGSAPMRYLDDADGEVHATPGRPTPAMPEPRNSDTAKPPAGGWKAGKPLETPKGGLD